MSCWGNVGGCEAGSGRDDAGAVGCVSDGEASSDAAEQTKTVRCVIMKDFDERDGRGSGDAAPRRFPLRRDPSGECPTSKNNADSIRLKNHIEWKRQKEAEYLRRREAERLEEEKRKEEKLREEKEKRRKEKEREEKMKEWQEQKAREKEERKREEMVLKAIEQEIKGVTQTLDKEKLIREWIRLKNKQKQVEAEKKAEMTRKEEESRALRQTLAEISYRQWKERSKTKRISLPKNGYQIFGPKPVPVVKDDWNHDFTSDTVSARTPKSTLSMTSIRGPSASRTDLGLLWSDPKKRSPSSCLLKTCASRVSVHESDGWKSSAVNREDDRWKKRDRDNGYYPSEDVLRLPLAEMLGSADIRPTRNKLDVYLQRSGGESREAMQAPEDARKAKKPVRGDNLKRYLDGTTLNHVSSKLLIDLSDKLSATVADRKKARSPAEPDLEATTRRSRSCGKPNRKPRTANGNPNRSSSNTTAVKGADKSDGRKPRKAANARRKPETVDPPEKPEAEARTRWKVKKPHKADTSLVADSPYCPRRKAKPIRTRKDD